MSWKFTGEDFIQIPDKTLEESHKEAHKKWWDRIWDVKRGNMFRLRMGGMVLTWMVLL